MNRNKFFVILATVVLLTAAACDGGFSDPGTLSIISGPDSGLRGGGVTGTGMPAPAGGGGSGGYGGSGSGGTLNVTDIPSQYNGKYAFCTAEAIGASLTGDNLLFGYKKPNSESGCLISNGRVSIPMWNYVSDGKGNGKYIGYSGDKTYKVTLPINDNQSSSSNTIYTHVFNSIKFNNGSATVSWNDGY